MTADLASHVHCVERIRAAWPAYRTQRAERLAQQQRHGVAAEKVAEDIVQDLFTDVLDWELSDLNNQIGYADLLLTKLGIKWLLIETKRPDALAWHETAVRAALEQARRYAEEQKVRCIAVSDGVMLYAADIEHGGLRNRVLARLDDDRPPEQLWWVSVHGIYRPCTDAAAEAVRLPWASAPPSPPRPVAAAPDGELLHPKYHVPARCFAYVASATEPATWKLPYLRADGSVDARRLPKAVQSILTNYRGARVSGIPEAAVPDILVRLARAAARLGRMPWQTGAPAPAYQQLAEALDQLGRTAEVRTPASDG